MAGPCRSAFTRTSSGHCGGGYHIKGARSMIPLQVVSRKYEGLPSREGSPRGAWGASAVHYWSPMSDPPTTVSWEPPSSPNPRPSPCRLCSVAQSACLSLFSDRAPRGATLEAYGEGFGPERKAHRGETAPVASGPALSGGVSSFIRAPPLSVTDTLRECEIIVILSGCPVNSTFP